MFSAVHHFCVQAASNHFAVLQSVGDLSSLIDSCSVNGVAAVGGTQCTAHDWLMMHKTALIYLHVMQSSEIGPMFL